MQEARQGLAPRLRRASPGGDRLRRLHGRPDGPHPLRLRLDQPELLDGVALLHELLRRRGDLPGEVADLQALDDLQAPPEVVTGKDEMMPSGTS